MKCSLIVAAALALGGCGGMAGGSAHSTICVERLAVIQQADVAAAAAEWNARVGTELRVSAAAGCDDGPAALTYVAEVRAGASERAGRTELELGGAPNRMLFWPDAMPAGGLRATALHELGHVLDVPHVADAGAIMFAGMNDVQHLTDSDLAAFEASR
jgi:hypothetical protein